MSKIKCELKKNGFYGWCNGMSMMLHNEANARIKGLVQINLYNFAKDTSSCLGVVYRKDSKLKGIKLMLNRCPWCGEKILNKEHIKKKNKRSEIK